MMTCPHSERLVALFYDGELEGPLRREVASHVSGCATCTGTLALLERGQELLCQAIEEQVEQLDLARFWDGVVEKLSKPAPPWTVRLHLWCARWWPRWSPNTAGWAVAAACVVVAMALFVSMARSPNTMVTAPQRAELLALAAGNQAQIESLSATGTVSLWNEPTSNATVIWVSDDSDGGIP